MKLRIDLVAAAILVASAGSELVAPDALYAAEAPQQTCNSDAKAEGPSPMDAVDRILAEGYTEVRLLGKGCDEVWHALALADGDPVNIRVTPQGTVLTE